MTKIKDWFLNQEMSWKKVIIFSVITAIITGVVMIIDPLKNTSLQDIGISYECWVLFAVFIIINCKKWWEASLKAFVFFLISQPLIYLIQVPFQNLGFGIFKYYKYWFIITLLTLPGAVCAYLLKRKDWISVLMLAVANSLIGYIAAMYLWNVIGDFPHHLISLIVCFLIAGFMSLVVFDEKVHKIVSIAVVVIAFIVSAFIQKPINTQEVVLPEGNWTYSIEDPTVASVEIDGTTAVIKAEKKGYSYITFTDENGNEIEYYATITSGGIYLNQFD